MDIKENAVSWDDDYDWKNLGEEWSEPWGNSKSQWINVLMPRLYNYFPAKNILEIACGHGRWSKYLIEGSGKYTGIDLAKKCVEFCQKRFAKFPNASFVQNNGLDLSTIKSDSIDLVFSFDSLVHVDMNILDSYFREISRVLKQDGHAFIHHSNLAYCLGTADTKEHVRAKDVDYKKVRESLSKYGLSIVVQEIVNWRNPKNGLIDCLTTIKNGSSDNDSDNLLINDQFMEHAEMVKKLSNYYK